MNCRNRSYRSYRSSVRGVSIFFISSQRRTTKRVTPFHIPKPALRHRATAPPHLNVHRCHRVELAERVEADFRQPLLARRVRELDHRPRRVVKAGQQAGVHVGKVGRDDAEHLKQKRKAENEKRQNKTRQKQPRNARRKKITREAKEKKTQEKRKKK